MDKTHILHRTHTFSCDLYYKYMLIFISVERSFSMAQCCQMINIIIIIRILLTNSQISRKIVRLKNTIWLPQKLFCFVFFYIVIDVNQQYHKTGDLIQLCLDVRLIIATCRVYRNKISIRLLV